MKTALNTAANMPWGGQLATPIQMPSGWLSHPPKTDFPALSDANISEVFRRAKALQSERDKGRVKSPVLSPAGISGDAQVDALHTRFFAWALHKLR